ncbi:ABC transporter permease [Candidatus Spongiisocius sp.]|uniref:ABC transporter permease n=1 Tax=Candidatus Spongiisocius sp. TaxID=3101273 RepID=UPI003B5A8166
MKKLGWQRRTRRRTYQDSLVGLALLLPCMVFVLLFFAYPLIGVFVRSVSDPAPGISNYVEIFSSRAFRNILRLTVEISVVTTVGCLFLGFPVAWYITTLEKRRAQLFLVLSTAPLWVAILARLYAWTVILGRRGIINDSLAAMGLVQEPLDLLFNTRAILIGMIHVMLPFMILVLYSSMRGVDESLIESADSLGARPRQTFLRIYLPLISPGLIAGSLLVLIMSMGFFILPAVLGGGGDITIPIYVQTQIRLFKWGIASAMSMILLIVTLALFALLTKVFDPRSVVVGGSRR